jgi:hypothetical protein
MAANKREKAKWSKPFPNGIFRKQSNRLEHQRRRWKRRKTMAISAAGIAPSAKNRLPEEV